MRVAAVVPNRDGRRWLPGVLGSLLAQTRRFDAIVVVDDGSADGSVAWLRGQADVRVVALERSGGFAAAANAGLRAAEGCDAVALVNSDVELEPDWLARTVAALDAHPQAAAVACKMVSMADPAVIDDAGDVLRRDGVCEQRGRGRRDSGRWDGAAEVWGACAGAALYRRAAVLGVGGFDERFGMYLEDVDLALRLRLAGWGCRYEPAVARHAGGGAGAPIGFWVARNTLVLVAKAFPPRWWPMVAYRQAAWLAAAARRGTLREHLRGLRAALPLLAAARRSVLPAVVPVEVAVPARPWRGPAAGGHPEALE